MLRLIVNTPRRRRRTQRNTAADTAASSDLRPDDDITCDSASNAGRQLDFDDADDDFDLES